MIAQKELESNETDHEEKPDDLKGTDAEKNPQIPNHVAVGNTGPQVKPPLNKVKGGGEIEPTEVKDKSWLAKSHEDDLGTIGSIGSGLSNVSNSNVSSLASGLNTASQYKEVGKLGGPLGNLGNTLSDKFAKGTTGYNDLNQISNSGEAISSVSSMTSGFNDVMTFGDNIKDVKGGKLKNALARQQVKNAGFSAVKNFTQGGSSFGEGIGGLQNPLISDTPFGIVTHTAGAVDSAQKTVDDSIMAEGFRKNKNQIRSTMKDEFSGRATDKEIHKQMGGGNKFLKGYAASLKKGGSISERWNRFKFNRAKGKVESSKSSDMKKQYKDSIARYEETGNWNHLGTIETGSGKNFKSFNSKHELEKYGEMHGLKSFAKLGHRRKGESATLNAVDTLSQGLQAVGTVDPHSKIAGKALAVGKSAYEGGRGLFKKWGRLGKLAEAKNTAGYGGRTDRGFGWKLGSFLNPFHKQEGQEATLQSAALKGQRDIYKSLDKNSLGGAGSTQDKAAKLLEDAGGKKSRYQRVKDLAEAKNMTNYGGNSQRDWKWKAKQYLFGGAGADLGAHFGEAVKDKDGRYHKGITEQGKSNKFAAQTLLDQAQFGKKNAKGEEMSRMDRVRNLALAKNMTEYGGKNDRGKAWQAKMYLFGGAGEKLGQKFRDANSSLDGKVAGRIGRAKDVKSDLHEGNKAKIERLTTRKLDKVTNNLMKVLREGKGKALDHAKDLVGTLSGTFGRGKVTRDNIDLQDKSEYDDQESKDKHHAEIGEDMGYIKKLVDMHLNNG